MGIRDQVLFLCFLLLFWLIQAVLFCSGAEMQSYSSSCGHLCKNSKGFRGFNNMLPKGPVPPSGPSHRVNSMPLSSQKTKGYHRFRNP